MDSGTCDNVLRERSEIMIQRFIARLLSGCWWNHDQLLNDRDGEIFVTRCTACRLQYPILASAIVRGPKVTPDRVMGEPTSKAMRVDTNPAEVVTPISVARWSATARRK